MMTKKLVAYFSSSGVTAAKAKKLAEVVVADLYEIAPKDRYTNADLNWTNKKARSTVEMNDPASRPELKENGLDLTGYDTVYIGFPIWWYTAPHIIRSFLEQNKLTGVDIVLFATSGGSSISKAYRDLRKAYPKLNITNGVLLNGSISGNLA